MSVHQNHVIPRIPALSCSPLTDQIQLLQRLVIITALIFFASLIHHVLYSINSTRSGGLFSAYKVRDVSKLCLKVCQKKTMVIENFCGNCIFPVCQYVNTERTVIL